MARLEGKVAIVTGAGRGIGRAVALALGREGARVVVNDLGGAVDGSGASRVADEVVEEIREAGGEAAASHDSVASVEGGSAIFQTAIDAFGACDILVNNAGILRDRTLFNMEEEDWDSVLAVHLRGHYCCTRPFVRYIREEKRPGCRIVNFSSVSGLYGNFGQANYGAAKAGIAGFSRVVALEVAKYGATCNTISPGAATRMTLDIMQARGRDPEKERRGPEEVAPVVVWLATPEAQHVTGQIFHVAGGLVGIMQQPAVIRAFQSERLWRLEDLDRAMPALLEAKRAHDQRVKEAGRPEPFPSR
jgi:NAD(P)-dependent dehydrogenase (short-subunit alcohol dehydrogenase family)